MTAIINRITFSDDKRHVEGWNNGTRVMTAGVTTYGLFGAVQKCLDYLRKWSGQEPEIDRELKAAMDRADNAIIAMMTGPVPFV